MPRRWYWIFLPFGLGLTASLIALLGAVPNPVLYAQADLGSLSFILGVGLSFLLGLYLAVLDKFEKFKIESIIQSAENRRQFLRRLDHELKNPLTAILAGLANLSVAEDPDSRSGALTSVQGQVARLRRLVSELRKLSELETRPLDRSSVDLTGLLEDVCTLSQEGAGVADRTLTLSVPRAPWPLPAISADRDLLILAVHNLVDNAVKFTNPGDTIEVRAFEDGAGVIVEVADTGPGIPVEDQDLVWDELYRGTGARGIPGSGLGLALVRAIVARHDGDISLRSRPGEGTVFTLRLPV